jgi:transposase
MSVYVGIDVHRKRSQVAVVTEDGTVQLNKNVVNGSEPFLRLIGDLPSGTPVAFEAAFGWSWPACWRTTASRRTWCTRCGARRSPRPG